MIRYEVENSEAALGGLAAYGVPISGLSPADFRNDPDSVFQIGQPPARVDTLQQIDGVEFESAWNRRTEASVDGIPAHIISVEDLIRNKLQSGRMRNLADVEAIREAQNETGSSND